MWDSQRLIWESMVSGLRKIPRVAAYRRAAIAGVEVHPIFSHIQRTKVKIGPRPVTFTKFSLAKPENPSPGAPRRPYNLGATRAE